MSKVIFVYEQHTGINGKFVLSELLPKIKGNVILCMDIASGDMREQLMNAYLVTQDNATYVGRKMHSGAARECFNQLVDNGMLSLPADRASEYDADYIHDSLVNYGDYMQSLGRYARGKAVLIDTANKNKIKVFGINLPLNDNGNEYSTEVRNQHMFEELVQLSRQEQNSVILCLVGLKHADVAKSLKQVEGVTVDEYFPYLSSMLTSPDHVPGKMVLDAYNPYWGESGMYYPQIIDRFVSTILENVTRPNIEDKLVSNPNLLIEQDKKFSETCGVVEPMYAREEGVPGAVPKAFSLQEIGSRANDLSAPPIHVAETAVAAAVPTTVAVEEVSRANDLSAPPIHVAETAVAVAVPMTVAVEEVSRANDLSALPIHGAETVVPAAVPMADAVGEVSGANNLHTIEPQIHGADNQLGISSSYYSLAFSVAVGLVGVCLIGPELLGKIFESVD